MKRFGWLLTALVLALALGACGGEPEAAEQTEPAETPETSEPSETTETTEATEPPEETPAPMTYEEAVDAAAAMDGQELLDGLNNEVRLNEYVGGVYSLQGTVEQVTTSYAVLRPQVVDPVTDHRYEYSGMLYLYAHFPAETLSELNTTETIPLVGAVTEVTTTEDGGAYVLVMDPAYRVEAEEPQYDTDPDTVLEMARIFGDDGDDLVSWTENSFPYFTALRDTFPVMTDEEIAAAVPGVWNAIEYTDDSGEAMAWEFLEDGTGRRQYGRDDQPEDYRDFWWSAEGGLNYSPRPDDVTASWSLHRASEDVLVGYDLQGQPRIVFFR